MNNVVENIEAIQKYYPLKMKEMKTDYGYLCAFGISEENKIDCVKLYNENNDVFAEVNRVYHHPDGKYLNRRDLDKDDNTVNLYVNIVDDKPVTFIDKSGSDVTLKTLEDMIKNSYFMLSADETIPVIGDKPIEVQGCNHATLKVLFSQAEKNFIEFHLKCEKLGKGFGFSNSRLKCGPETQ